MTQETYLNNKAVRNRSAILILIICLFLCPLSYCSSLAGIKSDAGIVITNSKDAANISSSLLYRTASPTLEFEEVSKINEGWSKNNQPHFSQSYSPEVYWIKVPLQNNTNRMTWYITLNNTRLDYVDFYALGSNNVQSYKTGDHRITKQASLSSYPTFKFQLAPNEKSELYIRIKSDSSISFDAALRSSEAFGEYRITRTVIHGLYAGLLILFFFIHVKLNPALVGKMEIYLCIAALSGLLYLFSYFGEANNLLWPGSVYLKNTMIFMLNLSFQIFLLLFLPFYIKAKDIAPRLNKIYQAYIIVLCLLMPILAIIDSNYIRSVSVSLAAIVTFGLVFCGQYVALRHGYYWTLLLTATWILFAVGSVIFTSAIFGLLPYNDFTANVLLFIYPLDVITLSLSLFMRYHNLAKERIQLKAKVEELTNLTNKKPANIAPENENVKLSQSDQRSLRIQYVDGVKILNTLTTELFAKQQLYLDESLTLGYVAQQLNIRADQLSAILNKEMDTSFPTLVNEYRIKEACRLLEDKPDMNILDIAFACGFGSRASFNRAFKQNINITPAAYRRNLKAA